MKRCNKCILPDTIPNINFDEKGICNFCNSYKPYIPQGRKALDSIIGPIKKTGKYDCIVPLSGGRDSSFVLWLAKNELGLTPLAVNYNNEFRVDQALKNMQNATQMLGVDFETVGSKYGLARKMVLSSVRASLPAGLSWNAGDACRACNYGYRSLVFNKAVEYSIPLIFWGETSLEATQDMEAYANKSFKPSTPQKYLNKDFYKSEFYAFLHRLEFHSSGNSPFKRRIKPQLHHPGIMEVRIFDYLQWDRSKLKTTIEQDLGWKAPEGSSTTWRTDCALHSLVNYCYIKLLGCSKDSFGLSKMICADQITREQALEREASCIQMAVEHIDELLENIGLTKQEIIQAKKITR